MRKLMILIGLLAACSGGETGSGGSGGGGTTPGAYQAVLDDQIVQQDALDAFVTSGAGFTELADLPTSGTTTYTADIVLSDGGSYGLAGSLTMVADWDCCEVTGTIADLKTQDDENLVGTLSITHGEIDLTGDPDLAPIVRADVIGTLRADAGDHISDEFDPLLLEGNFVGDAYEWFDGTIEGPVTAPDGTHTVSGDIAASR